MARSWHSVRRLVSWRKAAVGCTVPVPFSAKACNMHNQATAYKMPKHVYKRLPTRGMWYAATQTQCPFVWQCGSNPSATWNQSKGNQNPRNHCTL
jgi:hypothetical protein